MSIEIQWFIYALISNGALAPEDAVSIYVSLGDEPTLEGYAQSVLELLAANCTEEEAAALLEQIQEVVNYAVAQAETGEFPPLELPDAAAEEAPAPAPVRSAPRNVPPPRRGGAVPPRRGGAVPPRRGAASARPQAAQSAEVEDEPTPAKKSGKP